jgi:hypothetical protein
MMFPLATLFFIGMYVFIPCARSELASMFYSDRWHYLLRIMLPVVKGFLRMLYLVLLGFLIIVRIRKFIELSLL